MFEPVPRSHRRRVLKKGRLSFRKGTATLDVTLRDVNERGARIWTDLRAEFPERVDLLNDTDGTRTPCEVAWRRGGEAGLRFVDGAA